MENGRGENHLLSTIERGFSTARLRTGNVRKARHQCRTLKMVQPLKKHRSDNVDRAATSGGSSSLIATPLRSHRTRHQYAIRLDQLQWLLGQMPGEGAEHPEWITETAARNVVARWMKAGWVEAEQLRAHDPLWIWPTRKRLRKTNLPYNYRDIEQSGMDESFAPVCDQRDSSGTL